MTILDCCSTTDWRTNHNLIGGSPDDCVMSFFVRKKSFKSAEEDKQVVVEQDVEEESVGEVVDHEEVERQRVLKNWVSAQKVDYRKVRATDNKTKDQLVPEFNWILSQGLTVKQHVADQSNPFQIFIRLHESGSKLVWNGGVVNSWSGAREIQLSDVKLVSTGVGTSGFQGCSSSKQHGVDPAACMSLVLPYSFLGSEPHSLDLELASATEVSTPVPNTCVVSRHAQATPLFCSFAITTVHGSRLRVLTSHNRRPCRQVHGDSAPFFP